MDTARFSQIRKLVEEDQNTREEIEENIKTFNGDILTPEIEEKIKWYVTEKMKREDFSVSDLQSIFFKLHKLKFQLVDDRAGILNILYKAIVENVLLPENLEEKLEDDEVFYETLDPYVETSLKQAKKSIDKLMDTPVLKLELGDASALEREVDDSYFSGDGLAMRMISLGGDFGSIFIGNHKEIRNQFGVKIPIRINKSLKNSEDAKGLKVRVIEEILDCFINELEDFHDEDFKGNIEIFTEQREYFYDIYIYTSEEINLERVGLGLKLEDILAPILTTAEAFINEVGIESKQEYKNKIFVYSSSFILGEEGENDDIYDDEVGFLMENFTGKTSKSSEFDALKVTSKNLSLDDVGGQEGAKKVLEEVILSLNNEEIMKKWGAKVTKGIIFEGPAGTGKTMLAKVLASQVQADVYQVNMTDIAQNAYINKGANRLKKMFSHFKTVAKNKKVVVILDEIDALLGKRGAGNASKEDTKIVNTFLTELGGIDDVDNLIFVGTTNRVDDLDPAVVRSGRLGTKIKVDLPDLKGRKQIFEIKVKKAAKNSEKFALAMESVDYDELAKFSDKMSGADIEEIVRRVVQQKAMDEIAGKLDLEITTKDFTNVIHAMKKKKNTGKSIGFHANI